MRTLHRVCGMGPARFGTHWADTFFRYEYLSATTEEAPEDELWTVRVSQDAFDALGLRRGEPVRLCLPGHTAVYVQMRISWVQPPFVWAEFARTEPEFAGYVYSEG